MILILEPLDPQVMHWLVARHAVRYAPDLARDPRALRQALGHVQALVIPANVTIDTELLTQAPQLRVVGRLSAGAENIDFDACARAGVEVVRAGDATAQAEAEFMIGALLQMLRRVPIVNAEGLLVGRELAGSCVGLIGLSPAAKPMAQLLAAFGARVVGYDPVLHANDPLWSRWLIEPLSLRELMECCDGVGVTLSYFTRYHGLLGERYLPFCKPNQVMVSLAPTTVFEEATLAEVLGSGRMAAAWFDSLEPGLRQPGRALHQIDTLQVTPRVASTTQESRVRAAWEVAKQVDTLLMPAPQRTE